MAFRSRSAESRPTQFYNDAPGWLDDEGGLFSDDGPYSDEYWAENYGWEVITKRQALLMAGGVIACTALYIGAWIAVDKYDADPVCKASEPAMAAPIYSPISQMETPAAGTVTVTELAPQMSPSTSIVESVSVWSPCDN